MDEYLVLRRILCIREVCLKEVLLELRFVGCIEIGNKMFREKCFIIFRNNKYFRFGKV